MRTDVTLVDDAVQPTKKSLKELSNKSWSLKLRQKMKEVTDFIVTVNADSLL